MHFKLKYVVVSRKLFFVFFVCRTLQKYLEQSLGKRKQLVRLRFFPEVRERGGLVYAYTYMRLNKLRTAWVLYKKKKKKKKKKKRRFLPTQNQNSKGVCWYMTSSSAFSCHIYGATQKAYCAMQNHRVFGTAFYYILYWYQFISIYSKSNQSAAGLNAFWSLLPMGAT